jgi:hypothetical protein
MAADRRPEDATLLDVLVDGFEKNDALRGFHGRVLPLTDEVAAVRKFASLAEEFSRWKGQPMRNEEFQGRRLLAWSDLELRQAGRGVPVRVKARRLETGGTSLRLGPEIP